MEADGPGTAGKLRNTDLILAGSDGVSLDSILAVIMGIKPHDILTTQEAARRNLGVSDIRRIQILGEKLAEVTGKPFLVPTTQNTIHSIAAPFIRLVAGLVKYYPYADRHNCIRCGACIQVCPAKVISMKESKIVFDYRGCIRCFCCQETCPASAIKIKKSILAKVIGL
jgi:ferredoxin